MNTPAPALKPPGSGIPWVQRFVARRIMLPLGMRRVPYAQTVDAMQRQAADLRSICDGLSDRQLMQRVLIRPAPGLEDDSRFWSLAMVADHLFRVNTRVTECLSSLARGKPVPDGPTAIIDFKPDPASALPAIAKYAAQLKELDQVLRAYPKPPSEGTFPHPWFGPLNARQWAAFLPIHQSLHLTQARRIRDGLKQAA